MERTRGPFYESTYADGFATCWRGIACYPRGRRGNSRVNSSGHDENECISRAESTMFVIATKTEEDNMPHNTEYEGDVDP